MTLTLSYSSQQRRMDLQRNEWSSGGLDMLDFSQRDHYVAARMYNPLIGRWHNPDPMNQFDSPYNAMGNNPVINIDPDGMWSLPLGGILTGLSFTQIRYIANPRTMNNDPYMTTSGGMLQVAGAAISLWEGGKILSDGLYHLGFNTITNLNPEPFLGQVIYAYNYKDNQQYFYSLSIEWYKEEDISNFIGPRVDIISVSLSIEYIDNLPEGATAWFNGEVGNRGIYQMTDEEIAEYEESKLSYGPDVSLGGKAALKAGIKAARNAKKAAKGVTLPKIGIKYFDDIADLSNVTKNQLVSYSKQLESLYKNGKIGALTRDQAALLVKQARKLGVEVRIDKGHPGTFWNMDHLNIDPSGYHVPILPK